MTAPPQGYPMQYAPQPVPPRGPVRPRWIPGLLAGFAFLIAAGAAGWGTFEKIQSYRHSYPESSGVAARTYTYTMTWWKLDETGSSATVPRAWFPPYGVLVAIAGGLLVIAGVLALATFAGRRAGLVTGTRVSAAAGIGMLAGLASLRLMDSLQTLDQVNAENLEPGESSDFEMGLGVYLPAGAVGLGLIGLALMLNRGRAARVEPDTPRFGVPMPYPQQQYQPYGQVYGQQPVPQPSSEPIPAQPTSQPLPVQAQPNSDPFPVQQPPSQPFPAQPYPAQQQQYPAQQQYPTPQPYPVQQPASQPFPAQQPQPAPEPAAPAPEAAPIPNVLQPPEEPPEPRQPGPDQPVPRPE